MLAKLTSKNQLTLPKSVTDSLGPVQYFEVQVQAGQVVLTPVRIQRGDAVRAKLAELELGDEVFAEAVAWAADATTPAGRGRKKPAARSTSSVAVGAKASTKAVKKSRTTTKVAGKTIAKVTTKAPVAANRTVKTSRSTAAATSTARRRAA